MHDTILLGRISQGLEGLCKENNILKVDQIIVTVSLTSHVNTENLKAFLQEHNAPVIGEWSEILVKKEDIEEQSAVINSLKGDTLAR
jgi:Zn finger protein HypA/HybF involved in hydrogenase expression